MCRKHQRLVLIVATSLLVHAGVSFRISAAEPEPSATAAAGGFGDAWLSEVRRGIALAEYETTWQTRTVFDDLDAAWHAPNRAQGFRTYFTEQGIRVVPRTAVVAPWVWSPSATGCGRRGDVRSARALAVLPEGSRIEYDRGAWSEWYVNGTSGLLQGFTLAAPPPFDEGADVRPAGASEVWIELKLGGTLRPHFSTAGDAIDFMTPAGARVIHYALVSATDAAQRRLPARMEGFAGGIRLIFDDDDAVYPVTLGLLATAAAWTAEGDQPVAVFGRSVATAGDVDGDGYSDVVVGAELYDNGEQDEGRAFVYLGSAAGPSAAAAWTAEGEQVGARFGASVATAGDVNGDGYSDVIVGAPLHDDGEVDEGRAYVYLGSPAGLESAAVWSAQSDQASASFGAAVATVGDANGDGYSDVIVGSPAYDNGEADEGRAYVYAGSASGPGAVAVWTAESGQTGGQLGRSVATAGDFNGDGFSDAVVGAWLYDNGEVDEGRAYVYLGSPTGLGAVAAWTAESDQSSARFGISAATAGDVDGDGYSDVIVGADRFDNGEANEGRAWVFRGSPLGMGLPGGWTAEGEQADAGFGHAVAPAGDVNGDGYADVIVGAPGFDNDETDEGRVYVYLGSATGLRTAATAVAEGDQAGAAFGRSVAVAGDVNGDGYSDVIVGAPTYANDQASEGRAYVVHGSAAGPGTTEGWTYSVNEPGSTWLGYVLGTAGDVNGDGYSDVIVGAPLYSGGVTQQGRAYLFEGSSAGLGADPVWITQGGQSFARYGRAVGTAGDVNGDGYSDVIVGAPEYANGEPGEGRAYTYLGSAGGLSAIPSWTAEGDQPNADFGFAVGTAGDVNGDGYSDVVVGALEYENGQQDEGAVFVYHGSATGLRAVADWTAESNQMNSGYGAQVSTAGDANGDGYSDLLVGASFYANSLSYEGKAFLYLGSATGLDVTESWGMEGNQLQAYFSAVGTAGDVNGDGYSDVVVGANGYDNGEIDEGRAYLYLGSAAGLPAIPAWTTESDQPEARLGTRVGTAGDVNGDGYADVIIACYLCDNGEPDEGRTFLYLGSAAGLSTEPAWTAEGDAPDHYFGRAVATAGDVNGDGYSDVIVGATGDDRVYLYYGNADPGLSLRPEQRRVDDIVPIDQLGLSDSSEGFRLALVGRSPFGRGRVKLEWEVEPFGAPLDGGEIQSASAWTDSGIQGATLGTLLTGLDDHTAYHWRVRVRHDPVTTPFQGQGRWVTRPRAGWQEAMVRTAGVPAGSVDALVLAKSDGSEITLSWGASCRPDDADYAVYEGSLGDFASHAPRSCTTSGATTTTFVPGAGETYYLIVPLSGAFEGSYGTASGGAERPAGAGACLPQQVGECR